MKNAIRLLVFSLAFVSTILFAEESGANNEAEVTLSKKVDAVLMQKMSQSSRGETADSVFEVIVFLLNPQASGQYRGVSPFDDGELEQSYRESISDLQNQVLGQAARGVTSNSISGLDVTYRHQSNFSFTAIATKDAISALAQLEQVASIVESPVFEKTDAVSHSLTGTDVAHASGWTGVGVTIAVIDDGIDHDHAAFGGQTSWPNDKILGGYDFADNDNDPRIDCVAQAHGTAVAGVAAGNGGGVVGTAPDAKIVFLKVGRAEGCGGRSLYNIQDAIDWATTNRAQYGIKVVNMSLGGGGFASPCTGTPYSAYLERAQDAGLIVVAASGNSATKSLISRPACDPAAISVGAVYDNDIGGTAFSICSDTSTSADLVTCYSNSANYLDLLAPSDCALTALAGGGQNPCFNGTSSATPYVSGVIATMLQQDMSFSKTAILNQIKATGKSVEDPANGVVTPRVQHDLALGVSEPGIVSPEAGSVVSGTSVTFFWLANGVEVQEYLLTVGSDAGGDNYFNSGTLVQGTTSVRALGLPANGDTIHVQFRFMVGSIWKSINYTFISESGGDEFEPDNSLNTASVLNLNSSQVHSITPVGDVDYSQFVLSASGRVEMFTDGLSGDTVLELYDESGSLIDRNDDYSNNGVSTFFSRLEIDLEPGTYFVRVNDFSDNDVIAEYSLDVNFSVAGGKPDRPLLVSPSSFAVVTTPVNLRWTADSKATSYRLWVRDSAGSVVFDEAVSSSEAGCFADGVFCDYLFEAALVSGDTDWYVLAENAVGASPWSQAGVFTVEETLSRPGKVSLISPVEGEESSPVTLIWANEVNAAMYQLWLRDSSGSIVLNTTFDRVELGCDVSALSCSYSLNQELPSGNTTWYVRAENSAGKGSWSAAGIFQVQSSLSPPSKPVLIGPPNNVTVTVPFSFGWLVDDIASDYRLWVRDSQGVVVLNRLFSLPELGCGADSSELCQYQYQSDLPPGRTAWYVQAQNSAGKSPWSLAGVFEIEEVSAPGKVSLISPLGGSSSSPVTMVWSNDALASGYRIWIRNSTGSVVLNKLYSRSELSCDTVGGSCSFNYTSSLPAGGTTWYVQAENAAGKGAWSSVGEFTAVADGLPAVPSAIDPVDGTWLFPGEFTWSADPTVSRYQVVVQYTDGRSYNDWFTPGDANCGTIECYVTGYPFDSGGRYWVRAQNSVGISGWSATQAFTAALAARGNARVRDSVKHEVVDRPAMLN